MFTTSLFLTFFATKYLKIRHRATFGSLHPLKWISIPLLGVFFVFHSQRKWSHKETKKQSFLPNEAFFVLRSSATVRKFAQNRLKFDLLEPDSVPFMSLRFYTIHPTLIPSQLLSVVSEKKIGLLGPDSVPPA